MDDSKPRAWQWLDTGQLRKNLPATAEPGAWSPLFDQAAIDAAVAAAYERCAGMAENYDLGTPEGHAVARLIRAAAPSPRPMAPQGD